MKNILFPTDFSEAAEGALHAATHLSEKHNLHLHVMHAMDTVQRYMNLSMTSTRDPMTPAIDPEVVTELVEKQREEARAKLEKIRTKYPDITMTMRVAEGELHEEINTYGREQAIDLVIMGTHGASGFRETFIGSNAQKVVRLSVIPVLTIRDADDDYEVERMVFASDFAEEEINAEIPRVQSIAKLFDAELHLLFVNTPAYFERTRDSEARLKQVKDQYDLEDVKHTIYNEFNIEEGVIGYARSIDADLIAMVTHGYKGFRRMLNDNITETVVNHSKLPVLSLHPKRK